MVHILHEIGTKMCDIHLSYNQYNDHSIWGVFADMNKLLLVMNTVLNIVVLFVSSSLTSSHITHQKAFETEVKF